MVAAESAGKMTSMRSLPGVVLVLLALLHLVPPHGGPDPVVLGVLPWDLAWHLLWMVAAGAAVIAMTSPRLWPDDPP